MALYLKMKKLIQNKSVYDTFLVKTWSRLKNCLLRTKNLESFAVGFLRLSLLSLCESNMKKSFQKITTSQVAKFVHF